MADGLWPYSLWPMACGLCLVAYGLWLMAYGLWCIACGSWSTSMECNLRLMAYGLWVNAYGLWFLACGTWSIVHSIWLMAYSLWLMAINQEPDRNNMDPTCRRNWKLARWSCISLLDTMSSATSMRSMRAWLSWLSWLTWLGWLTWLTIVFFDLLINGIMLGKPMPMLLSLLIGPIVSVFNSPMGSYKESPCLLLSLSLSS